MPRLRRRFRLRKRPSNSGAAVFGRPRPHRGRGLLFECSKDVLSPSAAPGINVAKRINRGVSSCPALRPLCTRLRATIGTRAEPLGSALMAGYFSLGSNPKKSNQKKCDPMSAPSQSRSDWDGPLRFAAGRGGPSKAKTQPHQKQNPYIHLRHSRAGGNPVLAACTATAPPPSPLPQGEGGPKAGCREAEERQWRRSKSHGNCNNQKDKQNSPPSYRRKPVSRGQGCAGSRCTASARPS